MRQRPNPKLSPPPSLSIPTAVLDEAERRRRTVEMMTARYMTMFMAKHGTTEIIAEEIRSKVERRINESFDGYVLPDQPPYHMMIVNAIEKLNEEGGSTQEAISEHIRKTFPSLPYDHEGCLRQHLAKLGASGDILITDDNRYMLPVEDSVAVAKEELKQKSTKQKNKQLRMRQRVEATKEIQTQERENFNTDGAQMDEIIERSKVSGYNNMGDNGEERYTSQGYAINKMNVTDGGISDNEVAVVNNEADNGCPDMNGDKKSRLEKTEELKEHIQCKDQVKVTRGGGRRWKQTAVKRQPDEGKREQNAVERDREAGKYCIQVDKTVKDKTCGEGSEHDQVIHELNGNHENQNQACQVNSPDDQHVDVSPVHHCREQNCCYLELQQLREEVANWERRAASCGFCKCSEELKCLKEEMLETKRQMQQLISRAYGSLASSQGLINGPRISSEMNASKGDLVYPAPAERDEARQEWQGLQQIQEYRTAKKKSGQDDQIEAGDISILNRPTEVQVTALTGRPPKRKKNTELSGQPEDSISQPMFASYQHGRQLRPRPSRPKAAHSVVLTETVLSVPQHQQQEMIVKQVRGRGRPRKKVDPNKLIATQHRRPGRPRKQMQDSSMPVEEIQLLPWVSENPEEAQPVLQIEYHATETSRAVKSDPESVLRDTSKAPHKQKQGSRRGRGRPPKLHL